MNVAFVFIQGQAEYHVHVHACCTAGIVGYGKAQRPGRLRPVFYGSIFYHACLGYGAIADQRVNVAVQVVDSDGRPDPVFMGSPYNRILTYRTCAAEPVDGVRAGPRAGEDILSCRI